MLESLRRVFGKRLASRSVRSGAGRRLVLETLESRLTPSAYTGNQAMNLYRVFLDRVPEEQGLEAWVGALESERITVGQMAEGILRSPEHASRSVEGAYVEYLGRTPDSAGLAAHLGAVQRGVSPEWVDASILGSNEYFARHGSGNIPYVQALYLDVLGREADEPGLKAHVGALAKGSTRAQVAYTILTSAESGVQLAGQAYWEVLGREGAPEELAEWSGVFTRSAGNPSGGLTAVFAGVAGSPEGVKNLSSASMLDNPIPTANGSIRALLPRLEQTSDTGPSNSDNVTFVRTPTLTGGVEGPVSQVLIFIDGRPVDLVPVEKGVWKVSSGPCGEADCTDLVRVEKGVWKYTVPAEKALSAGSHTIRVQPRDGSGKIGSFSNLLRVTTVTEVPNAPTIGLAANSDSGAQGDGKTTDSTPTLRGVASPGLLVDVSIDGLSAGQVKADSQTGAWELMLIDTHGHPHPHPSGKFGFSDGHISNGVYDIEAVAINTAGLRSSATGFEVTINGERTVVLDGTDGNTVELMASHLLGQGSQGFIVTQVLRGTLQRWSAAENTWVTVPPTPVGAPAPTPTWAINAPAIRKIAFNEVVRWTPARGDVGPAPAFSILPMDTAGGLTAPRPEAGTVPGKLVDARVSPLEGSLEGLGQTITWKDPTDGCGCGSTRYSIEVTREDGQTLVYSVPRTVHGIPIVEGGVVGQAKVWGATKTGAGEARSFNFQSSAEAVAKLRHTLTSSLSFIDLGTKARSQLANSPTETQFTTRLALGNHTNLAYLQVDAVPDATEAALNLPAGTPMIVSSDSSKLTPKQLADLKTTPIYASHLFPGTVNGEVQPDQLRAHFQAGERLRFSGTVDAGVRTGATIVVESAQNLGDGSLGPWLEEARIPVGADGGFSHDYVVPYGMNSVRTRLEYRTQPAAAMMRSASEPSLGATSSTLAPISTPIDLSGYFNAFGITTPPWQVPNHQGFDGNGNYFNSDYTGPGTKDPIPGTPITYASISFPIGPIPTAAGQVGGSGNSSKNNPPNFVQARGQTITVNVDPDMSDYLYLAGAAANGDQISQKITLKFTDGTTETWTQSFHDWAGIGPPQSDATTPAHRIAQVKVAATSNIALTGLQTIDGVALVANDRVLLQNQSAPDQNGVYVVQADSWTRAPDADTSADIVDSYMTVALGTYAGKTFLNTNTGTITLGTTPITFVEGTPPQPAPRPFTGELLLKTQPERINQLGDLDNIPAHIFSYCYNLKGKQLASITLPNNENIGILSAVVAKTPVIALDEGFASVVLATTNLTGIDVLALTISNESNIGAGGGPLTFFFADQPVKGSTTSVALNSIATSGSISRDGQSFSGGGFDGDGNAYSWEALGSSKFLRGTSVNFELGLPGQPNFVVANGQTIELPQGSSYTTLNLAGAAVNGGQENQPLTLTFTDNSTAVWTQSFSDWCDPEEYANESTIATASYRDNASGETNQTTNHIYQYSYTIPSGKTLKSITLPTNSDVRLLDIQITPPTFTTKQVTVPMGQQTTIAYIAPNTNSQMTFYVQKADGSCVGPNCSTYLANWNNGSSTNKSYWAANISPSLNNQPMPGQHWTMTVQNAGMGYYGYLDSPSGQNLPHPGGVPGGAQFRLETQTEINAQPPWAVAVESTIGTILVLVGIGLATGGTGDVAIAVGEASAEIAIDAGAGGAVGGASAEVAVEVGAEVIVEEAVAVDPMANFVNETDAYYEEFVYERGNFLPWGETGIITTEEPDEAWLTKDLPGWNNTGFDW